TRAGAAVRTADVLAVVAAVVAALPLEPVLVGAVEVAVAGMRGQGLALLRGPGDRRLRARVLRGPRRRGRAGAGESRPGRRQTREREEHATCRESDHRSNLLICIDVRPVPASTAMSLVKRKNRVSLRVTQRKTAARPDGRTAVSRN